MAINVYLDESGDLGWSLDKPYRHGGSSRFLTIAYIVCPTNKKHLLKRIVKRLYSKYDFSPAIEVKGSSLSINQKVFVANQILSLLTNNSDVVIASITVKKQNVAVHIRQDGNKIYNYMIKLSLLEHILTYPVANLIRDNKNVKVKSGNSLVDYLQTELWFEKAVSTHLFDFPSESHFVQNLKLADWLNNIIWGHYEDGNSEPYNILYKRLDDKRLFF